MPKNQLSERFGSNICSLRTIYIAHKLAYELFLVLQAMVVDLFKTWQYGVPLVVLLKVNPRDFFLFPRPILAAVDRRGV